MQLLLGQLNEGTEVLMVLSIILFAGFIMTRLTNTLNLPKVSGYILTGVLIGPCCLDLIPVPIITHIGFVSDLALAFIISEVGRFFKREVLPRTGRWILMITLFEALSAGVMVTLFLRSISSLDWDFALMLGAVTTATAPASTMMIINQYKAKGEFVDTLLQVVVLNDVVCPLVFSVISAIASDRASNGVGAEDIIVPLVFNFLTILLGFFCRYFLSRLLVPSRSKDDRLILAIAMLLGISGTYAAANISPLLSYMVFEAAYIDLTGDKKLFRQINSFTLPVISIFFIVSGINLDVYILSIVGVIGFSCSIARIMGKYMGTYVSCLITNTSMGIRDFMGLTLIPQAGVTIGLTFLGQRLLPPKTGNLMLTIILSSSVLYGMVEPVSTRLALIFSESIPSGKLLEILPQEREIDENSGAVTIFNLIPASKLSQKDGESFMQIVEELNTGIDERDDDDIESAALLEEQKEKKKKLEKEHRKKREEIVEIPLEENVWAEGYEWVDDCNLKQGRNA